MGEAMLVRKGGATLRGLTLLSPPDKRSYYTGEYADITGAVVGAQFGTFVVPLHETALQYSPTQPLQEEDTAIVITATIGRVTKSIPIPITVEGYSIVLNENSWARIAYAASLGIASQLWNVGDIKYETINGVSIGMRIIGFDADPLDVSDAKYSDSSYNANKKKAAITFQYTVSPRMYYMNYNGKNSGGWDQCDMRVIQMQNELSLCPSNGVDGLRDVMRTVVKYTCTGGVGSARGQQVVGSADELFLLSAQEVFGLLGSDIGEKEKEYTSQYAWYASGQDVHKESEKDEWLRSPHNPVICTNANHFCAILKNKNTCDLGTPGSNKYYYPAFCV